MQTFKAFLKVAKDKFPSTFIYILIFFALILLSVNSTAEKGSDHFETASLNIYLIDNDNSDASKELTNYLSSMHHVTEMDYNKNVLLDSLFYRAVDYIIEIPQAFEKDLISGNIDSNLVTYKIPDSYSSSFIDNQISSYLKTMSMYLSVGYSLKDAGTLTAESFANTADSVKTLSFSDETPKGENKATSYFFQYFGYIMLLLLIMNLVPILTTFRKKDLEKRIICSSLTLTARNLQLTIGCIFLSVFLWALFLLPCFVIYGHSLTARQWNYYVLNSFVLMLVYVAISFFISNFTLGMNALNMISNILSLGICFFCGVFVPQNLLGESVLDISRFLPTYWYIRNSNMISGMSDELFSTSSYWNFIWIQVIFAVAIFSAALVATKILSRQRNEG